MSAKNPWYAEHLNIQNFCLISGITLMLCAAGGIELLGFKFDPSQDVSLTARLILLTSGVLITFSGLALHLQKAKIWKPRYTYLFFIVNIVFITLIGYAGLHQETETKSCLFRSWGATKNDFRATIETVNLKKHSAKYELLLICRKVDLTQDQGEG